MALTLVEAAKLDDGNSKRAAIIELFARSHDFLRELPFESIPGDSLSYNQEETLPGVAFRGVNEAYSESVGVLNPVTERLTLAGGDLDVDVFLTQTRGMDQRAVHEAMKVKNLAHTIAHKLIKGDSDTDPKEFDGLQKRLTGAQYIENGDGSGDPLDMTNLDELIDAVDEPTHLIMNKQMRRWLTYAARTTTVGGHIDWTLDSFGRKVMQYNDLPILIADANSSAFATLDFTEANSSTSIYCVSWREGMMTGIQNGEIQVRDLGEQDSKPVLRTRVEWYPGMALFHPRAAARLYHITNAAPVAKT